MKLPSYVKKYFWEVDADKLDLNKRNSEYIASRILEYGNLEASRWLLKNINKKIIRNVLLKRRGIPLRSRVFWALFFDIPKECLKKFYQKKQNNLWPY